MLSQVLELLKRHHMRNTAHERIVERLINNDEIDGEIKEALIKDINWLVNRTTEEAFIVGVQLGLDVGREEYHY